MERDIVLTSRARLNDLLSTVAGSLKVFEGVSIIGPAVKIINAIVRLVLVGQGIWRRSNMGVGGAWRASTLLLDLAKRMDGRWSQASRGLVQNVQHYQRVLTGIRDMITEASRRSWASRLLRNSSMKREMKHYNALLDHEFQRFQIAETVEMHYTLDLMHGQQSTTSLTPSDYEGVGSPPGSPAGDYSPPGSPPVDYSPPGSPPVDYSPQARHPATILPHWARHPILPQARHLVIILLQARHPVAILRQAHPNFYFTPESLGYDRRNVIFFMSTIIPYASFSAICFNG
ncbi:hypothetical protein C8R44DRAFT_747442 [Mycena epipterygia]|nr:hypothetical protein C8R44DRAFT_747442 [Mycena epipterygia]